MDIKLSITALGATTRDILPLLGAGNTVICRFMALSYAMPLLPNYGDSGLNAGEIGVNRRG